VLASDGSTVFNLCVERFVWNGLCGTVCVERFVWNGCTHSRVSQGPRLVVALLGGELLLHALQLAPHLLLALHRLARRVRLRRRLLPRVLLRLDVAAHLAFEANLRFKG
jgi:hypothetical protein